jgi:adenylate cyclase
VRELDLVRVKGRKEPVRIFELKPASSPVDARFAAALALYRAGKRDEAAREFAALVGAGPEDTPSRLYLERCRQAAAASWDGVHDLG